MNPSHAVKPADQLSQADFTQHRIWGFVDEMEEDLPDETYMRPVAELPVASLGSRVVGAQLILTNGQQVFGMIGNIELADPVSTEHFLTITIFHHGERFDLARYHDVDYEQRSASALANFLGLPQNSVFPIHFDISDVAIGSPDCLRRSISAIPTSRLSHDDLIALALR
jgi:hypothetical protein